MTTSAPACPYDGCGADHTASRQLSDAEWSKVVSMPRCGSRDTTRVCQQCGGVYSETITGTHLPWDCFVHDM
jgi:hypothetical protein